MKILHTFQASFSPKFPNAKNSRYTVLVYGNSIKRSWTRGGTEFNKICKEARAQHSQLILSFWANQTINMAVLVSDLQKHFQFLLCNFWAQFNLTWYPSNILMTSTMFVFFWQIKKLRLPTRPLLGWDTYGSSSATAELNIFPKNPANLKDILFLIRKSKCVHWVTKKGSGTFAFKVSIP